MFEFGDPVVQAVEQHSYVDDELGVALLHGRNAQKVVECAPQPLVLRAFSSQLCLDHQQLHFGRDPPFDFRSVGRRFLTEPR